MLYSVVFSASTVSVSMSIVRRTVAPMVPLGLVVVVLAAWIVPVLAATVPIVHHLVVVRAASVPAH